MREGPFEDLDVVSLLDVLQCLPYREQNRLLDQMRASPNAEGLFLTGIGDGAAGPRFACSQAVHRAMSFLQAHRPRTGCGRLGASIAGLWQRGFAVDAVAVNGGPPAAYVMPVARAI